MAVGHIYRAAALTGFSLKKIYGHFARTKKSDLNIEVTIREGSTFR